MILKWDWMGNLCVAIDKSQCAGCAFFGVLGTVVKVSWPPGTSSATEISQPKDGWLQAGSWNVLISQVTSLRYRSKPMQHQIKCHWKIYSKQIDPPSQAHHKLVVEKKKRTFKWYIYKDAFQALINKYSESGVSKKKNGQTSRAGFCSTAPLEG